MCTKARSSLNNDCPYVRTHDSSYALVHNLRHFFVSLLRYTTHETSYTTTTKRFTLRHIMPVCVRYADSGFTICWCIHAHV